jgi:hypothetical protein
MLMLRETHELAAEVFRAICKRKVLTARCGTQYLLQYSSASDFMTLLFNFAVIMVTGRSTR